MKQSTYTQCVKSCGGGYKPLYRQVRSVGAGINTGFNRGLGERPSDLVLGSQVRLLGGRTSGSSLGLKGYRQMKRTEMEGGEKTGR